MLLIPSATRDWLTENHEAIPIHFVLLVAASTVLAGLFRGVIGAADSVGGHVMRGALIPYIGCVVYLSLWNVYTWGRHAVYGGLANLHDSLVIYPWGLLFALMACLVVVPYGCLCQFILSRVLQGQPREK